MSFLVKELEITDYLESTFREKQPEIFGRHDV